MWQSTLKPVTPTALFAFTSGTASGTEGTAVAESGVPLAVPTTIKPSAAEMPALPPPRVPSACRSRVARRPARAQRILRRSGYRRTASVVQANRHRNRALLLTT